MNQKMTKRSSERDTTFAEGGDKKMLKPQAAGPAAPARTGKIQTPAPGAKVAKGGSKLPRNVSPAVPAKPGRTGAVRGR
jgi:hypothetical protein